MATIRRTAFIGHKRVYRYLPDGRTDNFRIAVTRPERALPTVMALESIHRIALLSYLLPIRTLLDKNQLNSCNIASISRKERESPTN
jgi:hypothetical protein